MILHKDDYINLDKPPLYRNELLYDLECCPSLTIVFDWDDWMYDKYWKKKVSLKWKRLSWIEYSKWIGWIGDGICKGREYASL